MHWKLKFSVVYMGLLATAGDWPGGSTRGWPGNSVCMFLLGNSAVLVIWCHDNSLNTSFDWQRCKNSTMIEHDWTNLAEWRRGTCERFEASAPSSTSMGILWPRPCRALRVPLVLRGIPVHRVWSGRPLLRVWRPLGQTFRAQARTASKAWKGWSSVRHK